MPVELEDGYDNNIGLIKQREAFRNKIVKWCGNNNLGYTKTMKVIFNKMKKFRYKPITVNI